MENQNSNILTNLLLSIVSLETLMYYYNVFHDTYTDLEKKFNKSFSSLRSIWFENSGPKHYSNYLNESGWIYDGVSKCLTSTNDEGAGTSPMTTKRIPWLSADLYYGSVKLDDCSSWISSLRYKGTGLTTDVILQVWAAEHTHKINMADLAAYRFEIIDENGTELQIQLGKLVA
jgi:hypothetical protein